MYLLGDFKINLLRVNSNANYFEYFSLMPSHWLFPTIFKPTRVTDGFKTLIFQNWCNTSVSTSNVVISSDISDHFPIFARVEEPGNFSDSNDSYVTIKCRLKNS